MRLRSVAAALGALALLAIAAPAYSRPASTYQINVTITDAGCRLALSSVSRQNTRIVFHLINNGHRAHGFRINGRSSPMIRPPDERESTFIVSFRGPGHYAYVCTGNTTTRMKGVFTIRRS